MAHKQQQDFCLRVKDKHPDFFKNKKVLDIGSLDLNGSNRFLFEDCNYIGIDVGEGRNVDVASPGNTYDGPDNYFDIIISTEVFEHDMYYEDTIKNSIRMLKPGGMFLFTCAANGRPEHGTRKTSVWDAPLLVEVSEEWSDYYKNLEKEDIQKISNFNETFVDGYFERGYDPDDLYFYGIKGGEKYLCNVGPQFSSEKFKDDIFVIDCWTDTQSKENDLLNLIKRLKIYNVPILLTGHYPIKPEIQKMVDYYLFDKKNDLLMARDFEAYDVSSGRWTNMGSHRVDNALDFHHDYAIWETMRNSFNFCNNLGKKNIHFFEYDNLPDDVQYRQAFLERIGDKDAVLYEYNEGSSKDTHFAEYCATFIFSIKTDIALKTIKQINSKEEYFKNKPKGWQLERVFLDSLKKVTNNIHISDYIANDNELNTQAVWNRDGMDRNGARFQIYPAVDNHGDLYVHLISGFHEKPAEGDYLIEVNYRGLNKFYILTKGSYLTEKIGEYRKGEKIKIYYQGVEVYNQFLGLDVHDFRETNKVTWLNKEPKNVKVNVNFVDGPFIEITEDNNNLYNVQFIDNKNGKTVFEINLKSNHWARCARKYYTDWLIKVQGVGNDFYYEHDFNVEDKRVYIAYETKSLGDSLAFIPYVEKFGKDRKCKVICSTFHNNLFVDQYPDIEFVDPSTSVDNIYALYRLGLFYETIDGVRQISYNSHPTDPKKEPLLKVASDILGLDYVEVKTRLKKLGVKKEKRVCIAIHSTAQSKYWNNPTGWQDVVDYLNDKGYEVRLLSMEHDGYMDNWHPTGIIQQPKGSLENVIKTLQESELFIGISSGLSWLSWAAGTETIIVSGFTDVDLEPFNGVTRVINKDVCNSCWSNHDFDPGDWNWCPIHKGTDRQFECSKNITSESVIKKISEKIFL
jgi:autotransporter strand-loop-strand O-heptosyltransferase